MLTVAQLLKASLFDYRSLGPGRHPRRDDRRAELVNPEQLQRDHGQGQGQKSGGSNHPLVQR